MSRDTIILWGYAIGAIGTFAVSWWLLPPSARFNQLFVMRCISNAIVWPVYLLLLSLLYGLVPIERLIVKRRRKRPAEDVGVEPFKTSESSQIDSNDGRIERNEK